MGCSNVQSYEGDGVVGEPTAKPSLKDALYESKRSLRALVTASSDAMYRMSATRTRCTR